MEPILPGHALYAQLIVSVPDCACADAAAFNGYECGLTGIAITTRAVRDGIVGLRRSQIISLLFLISSDKVITAIRTGFYAEFM